MRYVKLSDGTIIQNCDDRTTAYEIFVIRDTNAEAASIADLMTRNNTRAIKVFDSDSDQLISSANDLKMVGRVIVEEGGSKVIGQVMLHPMDRLDIIEEEIAELQEAILG